LKKSTRIFILLAVIEVLIVAGATYMLMQVTSGAWRTFDQAEAVRRIMTVMGGAFGGIGLLLLTLAIVLRIRGQ
jgi:hypothetical protein